MKKPSLEKIKEKYKNAEVVACLSTGEYENISQDITEYFNFWDESWWIRTKTSSRGHGSIELWNKEKGFAGIVTYKKPIRTNKLTELEKRVEVLEHKVKQDDSVITIPGLKPSDFKINILGGEKQNHLSDAFSYLIKPVNPIGENIRLKARIEELEAENKAILAGNSVKLEIKTPDLSLESALPKDFTGWVKDVKYPKFLAYAEKGILKYGFDANSNWVENTTNKIQNEVAAEESEVFEALKNEAVKRGYKDGVWVKYPWYEDKNNALKPEFNRNDLYNLEENYLLLKGVKVFNKGDWAEIQESITKSEAEKQLGKKIIY